MYLHRMDLAVATKVVDNEREIRIRQIDADLQRREIDYKSLAARQDAFLKHERETALTDRREIRLIASIVAVLLLGGGLALLFAYFEKETLASTALVLLVTVVTSLVNALVNNDTHSQPTEERHYPKIGRCLAKNEVRRRSSFGVAPLPARRPTARRRDP